MKVKDNITVRIRTQLETLEFAIELTYVPKHTKDMDAVQVKYRGFKRAALLNPEKVNKYGTYEMMCRFLEYFFGSYMQHGACEVVGFTERKPKPSFGGIVVQVV
jgi:hypothetical protein